MTEIWWRGGWGRKTVKLASVAFVDPKMVITEWLEIA